MCYKGILLCYHYNNIWQSHVEIEHYSVAYFTCITSAVAWKFRYRWGSYTLGKLMNTYHIYTARLSPALSRSSALEHFERSNVSEIRNGILFDFYLGLPHMLNTVATVTISLHHSPVSVSFIVILLFIMTQLTITMVMVMIIINPAPPVTPA